MKIRFEFTGRGVVDVRPTDVVEWLKADGAAATDVEIANYVGLRIMDGEGPRIEINDVDKNAICAAVREEIEKGATR